MSAFLLGTIFFGYAFTQRVAPSVMTEELMRDFSVGAAALGSLSALYFYSYAGMQVPVGMLLDRFGPRKLMSVALLFCCIATLGFGISDSLELASISRFFIGGTVAFGFVSTLTIASYWFSPGRFVMLSGILMTVGMVGAMLGQAPLRLSVELSGWRDTIFMLAAIAAVLAVLIYLVVPHRSPDQINQSRKTSPMAGFKSVVCNPQSWFCAGIGFGPTSALLGFAGLWAVPWLSTVKSFSIPESAVIASAIFLGWAIAAPVVGWLSDRIGARKPIVYWGLTINALSFLVIVYASIDSAPILFALFLVNGMSGSTMVISFGIMREHNAPENNATALALLNMFVVGSGAVMQPVVGVLLDSSWNGEMVEGIRMYHAGAYNTAFFAIVAANALALVCCILLRETYCRQQNVEQHD